MGYAIVYIKGSNLDVQMSKPSEVKIIGVLRELTLSFLGRKSSIAKLSNEYGTITLKGLALNVKYVSSDLVIVEGLLEKYEVRPEENMVVTLYQFEQPQLQEPDLDEL